MTLERFRLLEAELRHRGYGPMIAWSESIEPATNADAFAERAIYVICNSGMSNRVAMAIFHRSMAALHSGGKAQTVFGHPGKSAAIDTIWREREELFTRYLSADDPFTELLALPWIGEITAHHLAKNLGTDTAKPDVHLERIARRNGTTTEALCAKLASDSGYRVATIDSILWRACADRILDSAMYEVDGWDAAFRPDRNEANEAT